MGNSITTIISSLSGNENEIVLLPEDIQHHEGLPFDPRIIHHILKALTLYDQVDRDSEDSEVLEDANQSLLYLILRSQQESKKLVILKHMIGCLPVDNANSVVFLGNFLEATAMPTLSDVTAYGQGLAELCNRSRDDIKTLCHINYCWAFISERMAGIVSERMFHSSVLDLLIDELKQPESHDKVVISALVALEKFSLTTWNKTIIGKDERVIEAVKHLVETNETDLQIASSSKRQISFLARWLWLHVLTADPIPKPANLETGCIVDLSNSTVGWHLSTDGLQIRSDSNTFQSFRASRGVSSGRWFYEITLLTNGVMQLGWAAQESIFDVSGDGVGDSNDSIGFDGCRSCVWFSEPIPFPNPEAKWEVGDVIGFEINFTKYPFFIFYINGKIVKHDLMSRKSELKDLMHGKALFPAGSLTAFQHVELNFGQVPFKFPPKDLKDENMLIKNLTEDERKQSDKAAVYLTEKRHRITEAISNSINDLSKCTICFSQTANTKLSPCSHSGFCHDCCLHFERCPICRAEIKERVKS